MGFLAHPDGLGQPISEVMGMTVSQMKFWCKRAIEINSRKDK